jgi:hypothetical protein
VSKRADLGANLVDQLLPLVGDLRDSLHSAFGVRQFRVFIVRRAWSGTRRGEGSPTIVSAVEINPRPLVETADTLTQDRFEDGHGGFDPGERVTLREVDLRYAEAELTQEPVRQNEDVYYRIEEGQGQKIRTRYFMLDATPEADRVQSMGWIVRLRRVEIQE